VTEHDRIPPLGELKATRRDVPNRPPRAPEPAGVPATGDREYDLLLRESPPRALGIFQQILAMLVRLMGLGFLVVGIGATVIILNEAWMLYQEPARIEKFAVAIERGSNLDKIFALSGGDVEKADGQEEKAGAAGSQPADSDTTGGTNLRLSYFAGWFLVLLLMLVGSIVAISAVSAGGRLVLFDTDIRQLSRAVVKEVRRNKSASHTGIHSLTTAGLPLRAPQ
jgi:hypothetical protein